MKKLLTLLSMAVGIFAACQQEDIIQPNEVPDSDKVIVNLAIDGEEEIGTKSVVTIAESGIADITLFIFQDGKCSEAIYATPTNGKLNIVSEKGYASNTSIDVYGVLNMGDRRSEVSIGGSVSTLGNLVYNMGALTSLNSNGFPMAGSVTNAPVGTPFTIHMRRLTAKYGFKINTSNLKYGKFTVTSLQFKNAMRYAYPFVEQNKATATSQIYASSGDYATSNNITALNNGYGINFYALENCQGTLLPGNTDPWQKIPSNISSKKDLCTYIEVKGTYTDNSGGLTATHTYRMYLGQDNTTNFDVIRNTMFDYTLGLSDDGFLRANWKAERVVNSDSRSLSFAKSTYEVKYGEDCNVVVNYSPKKFDCKFTLSQNLINAGVSFDSSYMVLRQSRELDADVTGTLTATSWDGVKTAICNVVAKKHEDDIIIIIKPEATALKTSVGYYGVEVGAYMGDELLSNDYADYEVESSNENVLTCNIEDDEITSIIAWNKGTATLTAKFTRNGQTYTASQDFTVAEDRTITVSTNQNNFTANNVFPVNIKTNFSGTIRVNGDNSFLQFSTYSTGTFSEYLDVHCGSSSTKTVYAKYIGSTASSPTITAVLPQTTIKGTKTISVTLPPKNLTLTITDWEDFGLWSKYTEGLDCDFRFGHLTYNGSTKKSVYYDYWYDYDYDVPSNGLYYFEGDVTNSITGTKQQWQNLIDVTCYNDDKAGWIDGEWESLAIGEVDYYNAYESCGNYQIFNIIKDMIANECDAETTWLAYSESGTIVPPPTPDTPVTKPTKTFYLWPSKAYRKSEEDKENNYAYVKFTTNDLYWKHKIEIELAFPNADWAHEPFCYGPGTNGIFQIDNLKWDYEIGGIEMQISDEYFSVVGTYPERMWISAVYGLSSSQYEIEETYETVTGFSGPLLCRRTVTIEESDYIYKYVIEF